MTSRHAATAAKADDEISEQLTSAAEFAANFLGARRKARVASPPSDERINERLARYDFHAPCDVSEVAADMFDLLGTYAVRSDHPMYFGLFNPPALPAAIIGDLIAAAVNPQLAVWSHAPAAAAIECKLLRFFGACVGWSPESVAGTFTSGGSEANHTAVLVALAKRYPGWERSGLQAIRAKPSIYVSEHAHMAWIKIARNVGLGSESVRLVPTDNGLSLSAETLTKYIAKDHGRDPLIIVATAGTTAHGAVDDIGGMTQVAKRCGAHMHVDAAWAGGALLASETRDIFHGIETADSVTIDAHKWLSVPMGAGMYLSRDWTSLEVAFGVRTSYMPSASTDRHDAFIHSLQWSRRFIGCKVFMALAALGRTGYARIISQQFALGRKLRAGLMADGWRIVNDTPLPLLCFVPDLNPDEQDRCVRAIEAAVVASGAAWISSAALKGRLVLRACITSYETTERDVEALLELLDDIRASIAAPKNHP